MCLLRQHIDPAWNSEQLSEESLEENHASDLSVHHP